MRANFVSVPYSGSVFIPTQCSAYAFSSLYALLATPSSGPNVLAGRCPDYASTMGWSDCHAAVPPPHLFGFVEGFSWERHGSPKFRCKPLDYLPRTQTPARHDTLTKSRAVLLASRT